MPSARKNWTVMQTDRVAFGPGGSGRLLSLPEEAEPTAPPDVLPFTPPSMPPPSSQFFRALGMIIPPPIHRPSSSARWA